MSSYFEVVPRASDALFTQKILLHIE
jgi:hypothetical protein